MNVLSQCYRLLHVSVLHLPCPNSLASVLRINTYVIRSKCCRWTHCSSTTVSLREPVSEFIVPINARKAGLTSWVAASNLHARVSGRNRIRRLRRALQQRTLLAKRRLLDSLFLGCDATVIPHDGAASCSLLCVFTNGSTFCPMAKLPSV